MLAFTFNHPVGYLAPLHCTALGKAFPGFGPAEAEEPLQGYTANTIPSIAKLRGDNRCIRRCGYAEDDLMSCAQCVRCVARANFNHF